MGITKNSHIFNNFGGVAAVVADLAVSGAYAHGGLSLDNDALFGIHTVELALLEAQGGYSFVHDKANQKVKIFSQAPPIVYDEHQVADTDGLITLKYPAAFIMNAATPGQNLAFRSTGVTPAATQIALTDQLAKGERTTLKALGYEELAGDGAFTGAATNWSGSDSLNDWTYGTNNIAKDQDGVETLTHDNFAAVIGRTYLLTFTISSWTVGSVTPTLGGTAGTARSANGTYTEQIVATTTDGLVFTPTNTSRFTLDSVTVYNQDVYVTYITQAWKDVWDNLVQDESVTLSSSGATTLDNQVLAVMYLDQITATAGALVIGDEDESAADSGKVSICFNQTADAVLTTHADQNAKVCKLTYLKNPGSGFLHERAFDNESGTKSGSGDPYANTFDYPLLLWGYCGQMPVVDGTTQVLLPYFDTAAAGEVIVDWYAPGARGSTAAAPAAGLVVSGASNVVGTAAGVWGRVDEIVTVPIELADGETLSLSSVKALFIGA